LSGFIPNKSVPTAYFQISIKKLQLLRVFT
jgi:hypothetical protein